MVCEMKVHVCVRVWLFIVCGSFIFSFVDSPFYTRNRRVIVVRALIRSHGTSAA